MKMGVYIVQKNVSEESTAMSPLSILSLYLSSYQCIDINLSRILTSPTTKHRWLQSHLDFASSTTRSTRREAETGKCRSGVEEAAKRKLRFVILCRHCSSPGSMLRGNMKQMHDSQKSLKD
jgi:hypothetical protein